VIQPYLSEVRSATIPFPVPTRPGTRDYSPKIGPTRAGGVHEYGAHLENKLGGLKIGILKVFIGHNLSTD